MGLNIWDGLNIGLEFDEDESGQTLSISIDHDDVKGEASIDFYNLLEKELDENFDDADSVEIVTETVIPEYEGILSYLKKCQALVETKIEEAQGFIRENS